ncbi:hypothetical protein BJ165DRAFT_1525967 [Panaeolus papilionaceus]|nr:hypothetical protein BJ165DRAFT_1525967 [Panaeolus papilionaceus]
MVAGRVVSGKRLVIRPTNPSIYLLLRQRCDGQLSVNVHGGMACQMCQRLHIQCVGAKGDKRDKELRPHIPWILKKIKKHLVDNGLSRRAHRPLSFDQDRVIPTLMFWHTEQTSDTEPSPSPSGSSWDTSSFPPSTPITGISDSFDDAIEKDDIWQGNVGHEQMQLLPRMPVPILVYHPPSHPTTPREHANMQQSQLNKQVHEAEYGSSYAGFGDWITQTTYCPDDFKF